MAQGEQAKTTLTPEMRAMLEANRDVMLEFVKELRKPTDEEQRKRDEERKKKLEAEESAFRVAQAAVQAEEMKRMGCPHAQKLAGQIKHAWRGQVSSGDGMVRAHCNLCRTEAPIFKASAQQIQNGINLEGQEASLPKFEQAHKQTFPQGCTRGNCYVCHPKTA